MKFSPPAVEAAHAIQNPEDIPRQFQQDAILGALRAIQAGAEPSLEYMGMGMTAVVFCDPHFAFKVARGKGSMLADEADWLRTAGTIPEVRPHVAKLEHWDPVNRVIVRECVRGERGTWGGSGKIHALWDKLAPYMLAEGWLMPELKEDSVVFVHGGLTPEARANARPLPRRSAARFARIPGTPVIVDAGFVSRVSNRLLGYVEKILDGKIDPGEYEDYGLLAFYIRSEFGRRQLDEPRAHQLLERLYALGARR